MEENVLTILFQGPKIWKSLPISITDQQNNPESACCTHSAPNFTFTESNLDYSDLLGLDEKVWISEGWIFESMNINEKQN